MSVKLENFSTYFAINGTPQQRGAYRVIIHDETLVGLAILGTGKELVFPVHFSEWIDGTDTPYPTFAALISDLQTFIYESNAAGIPDAPADNIQYGRQNNAWTEIIGEERRLNKVIEYEFDNDVIVADPGPGDFSINHADVTLADRINFSVINPDGFDFGANLAELEIGDSIILQSQVRVDEFIHYQINATPTNHVTWFEFPVSVIAAGADNDFLDGSLYHTYFTNFPNESDGVYEQLEYTNLPDPFSTNSTSFVEVLSHFFYLLADTVVVEMNFNFEFQVDSASQSVQFQFLLNGVPLPNSYTKEMSDTTDQEFISWTLYLPNLDEGTHTFEVQIRKVTGNANVTVLVGNINSKRKG